MNFIKRVEHQHQVQEMEEKIELIETNFDSSYGRFSSTCIRQEL